MNETPAPADTPPDVPRGFWRRPPRWLVALAAFDLALRAAAMVRALRNGDRRWVLALAVVSSGGLLPLLYLRVFGPEERLLDD